MKKIGSFEIRIVVENGIEHYKVTDHNTGEVIHCDIGELNKVLAEIS